MLPDGVTVRKEAGSEKLAQNDGVAVRLPIFFGKPRPLEYGDLKDMKVSRSDSTQDHGSTGSRRSVRSARDI